MTSLSEKIMTTDLRILSKNDILQIFKKPISPAKTLESLISALPDVFVQERLEPENSKRHLPPNPAEVFVLVSPLQKPNRPMEKAPRKKVFIQKSPFTNSGYSEDPSLRVWYYIDEADRIQGPFTSLEMDHWFDSGFFFNELLVRFKEQNDFIKLVELFGKTEQPQNYRIIPQEKNDHSHQKPKLVDVNIWEKIKPTGNTKEEPQKPAEKSNNITQDNVAKDHKAHPVKTDKAPAKDKTQEPITRNIKEEKKEEKPIQGKKAETPVPLNWGEPAKTTKQEPVKSEDTQKPKTDEAKNVEKVTEPKKVVEEKKAKEQPKPAVKKEEPVGPKPVENVPDPIEQGEWTAIKKINKNKKGANKKSGSRKDIEQPEELPVNTPVQEPVKEEPQPKVETTKNLEPVKDEKIEVKPNPVAAETQKINQPQEVQHNLPQTQEPEKKAKGQSKKKTIGAWNVDNEKESPTNVPETKTENSADFPSLGEPIKQAPKQEKKPPKEVSKTEDTQQAKSNKPTFYKAEESEDYPTLSHAAVKQNLPEKPKTNASSGVKATNKQSNTIKQSTNKSGTWASQSVKDNQKTQAGSTPKYLDDFPSL